MSTTRKLAGFGAVLLLVFGGAVIVGGAIGPDRDDDAAARADGESHAPRSSHGADHSTTDPVHAAADPVRGLAVVAGGLELALQQTELPLDRPAELRFRILGSDGQAVRDFELEHEKRMHLIVVRRDGQGFQHLHPALGDDGVWRVRVSLPDAGAYRVFADFKHGGEAQTLAADLAVDGDAGYQPLPAPATTATTRDGYEVQLDAGSLRAGREAELRFTVTRGGRTIRTQPYLGAAGHLVALREGDLAYLHVHPQHDGEAVSFMTELPSAGRYRLYLQFKHDGRVHTAELTQEVAR